MKIVHTLKTWFRRHRVDADMIAEMQHHLELQTQRNREAGMSEEDAHYAAMREFGNIASVQERAREGRAGRWLEESWRDCAYAVRQCFKAPVFTVVAIATLAIGIGSTTAIFSVVNSVVLRPLAYPDSSQLVTLREWYRPQNRPRFASLGAFFQWKDQSKVFEQMGAATSMTGNLTGEGDPLRLYANLVTSGYFEVLRVQPALGRGFRSEEYNQGKHQVMVLNHRTWMQHFGGTPDVLGRSVTLNGYPITIIGVMPKEFQTEPGGPMAYLPFVVPPESANDFREPKLIAVIARLKSGITLDRASVEMDGIAASIEKSQLKTHENIGVRIVPLLEATVGKAQSLLWILLGAVGCLLLIACVNVANLLLLRASARRHEIALRAALGAGRRRLVRQLLVESLLLAGVGGVLGVLAAHLGMQGLLSFAPVDLPRIDEVKVDGSVLAFSLTITLLVGFGFGFVPAWQSTQGDLTASLKDGAQTSDGPQRHRLRSALIVAQISLALILLTGAGLLLRSFDRLKETDIGYNPNVVYVSRIFLLWNKYPDDAKRLEFVDRSLERYAEKPDLVAAAFTSGFPHHQNPSAPVVVEGGGETDVQKMPRANWTSITPLYFQVMSMPMLSGREFNERDRANAPRVAIVSRRFAEEHFPGTNPLGKRISVPTPERQWCEIVGVVPDILLQSPTQPSLPQIYVPLYQMPTVQLMTIVRTRPGAANPVASVAASIHAVDPQMPVPPKLTLIAEYVENAIAVQRFAAFVFSCLSGVAVLLAAIGLYGVMAYAVSQRTREIGIRMALGAQRRQVMQLILSGGGKLVILGLAIGISGALAGTRLLESLLFKTNTRDPLTFMEVSGVIVSVALFACIWPAFRATRVNPVVALRRE